MSDYEPLNLAEHLNGGLDALGAGSTAEIGPRHFRGLPFAIGDDPARCFISLDGDSEPVNVPVGGAASRIIFAHRLLTSDIDDGGPVGVHVADYVFSLVDGQQHVVSIRERFETGFIPTDSFRGASGLPFLAVTDGKHRMMPRKEGQWQELGRRQTEYLQATARSYFLWSWTNPEPDVPVESIEIVPRGPAFVIAGVTLSHVDERPFARHGRREAVITITDPVLASDSFDLEVEVDRGDSTYAFPLPKDPDDGFLEGYHKGFGRAAQRRSQPLVCRDFGSALGHRVHKPEGRVHRSSVVGGGRREREGRNSQGAHGVSGPRTQLGEGDCHRRRHRPTRPVPDSLQVA